jgi:hypothetical protein
MMLAQSLTVFRRGVCSFSLQVRACIGTAKFEANCGLGLVMHRPGPFGAYKAE